MCMYTVYTYVKMQLSFVFVVMPKKFLLPEWLKAWLFLACRTVSAILGNNLRTLRHNYLGASRAIPVSSYANPVTISEVHGKLLAFYAG